MKDISLFFEDISPIPRRFISPRCRYIFVFQRIYISIFRDISVVLEIYIYLCPKIYFISRKMSFFSVKKDISPKSLMNLNFVYLKRFFSTLFIFALTLGSLIASLYILYNFFANLVYKTYISSILVLLLSQLLSQLLSHIKQSVEPNIKQIRKK